MKELSIEEKAKAYDEAIERAKRLHSEPTGGTERIVCEQIFPALKENKENDDDTCPLQEPTIVYVITRCEEHSDYVEQVFLDRIKAEDYCKQFEGDENEYGRDITKIQVTL